MKKSRQKKTKKKSTKDVDQKQRHEEKCPKTKSIMEFDPTLAYNVNCLAVKIKILTKNPPLVSSVEKC